MMRASLFHSPGNDLVEPGIHVLTPAPKASGQELT
jgi:hypothetical protein